MLTINKVIADLRKIRDRIEVKRSELYYLNPKEKDAYNLLNTAYNAVDEALAWLKVDNNP
jgi:hypothetical protein